MASGWLPGLSLCPDAVLTLPWGDAASDWLPELSICHGVGSTLLWGAAASDWSSGGQDAGLQCLPFTWGDDLPLAAWAVTLPRCSAHPPL